MLLELKQLTVPTGQKVLLKDVSWQEFEAILTDLSTPVNGGVLNP